MKWNKEPFYKSKGVYIIGDVRFGENVSVWFGSVLRADINYIQIGNYSNIQDLTVVHLTEDLPVIIGDYVTVGHRALIHGCEIGNNVLIGMGAIILDRAKIGNNCIVAAGSVIKEGMVVPDNTLVAGVPAKIKREVTEEEVKLLKESALHYVEYATLRVNNE